MWQFELESPHHRQLVPWWPSSPGAAAPAGFAASVFEFRIGRISRIALGGTPSADHMRLPGKQRPVIHRELRIIRRISREDLQDRAQDSTIEGNLRLTNGDSHEEPKHPLFQTYRLCSCSRYERLGFGRPRISLRAAVSPEHVSDRFRQGGRFASVAELVLQILRRSGRSGIHTPARHRRIKDVTLIRLTDLGRRRPSISCDILPQASTRFAFDFPPCALGASTLPNYRTIERDLPGKANHRLSKRCRIEKAQKVSPGTCMDGSTAFQKINDASSQTRKTSNDPC
jgi:hypothetical protein